MYRNLSLREIMMGEFGALGIGGGGAGLGELGYQGRTASDPPIGWTPNPEAWIPDFDKKADSFHSALNTAIQQIQEPWIKTQTSDVPNIFTDDDTLWREIFGPYIPISKISPYLMASNGPIPNLGNSDTFSFRLGLFVENGVLVERWVVNGEVKDFRVELSEEITVTAPREPPSLPAGQPAGGTFSTTSSPISPPMVPPPPGSRASTPGPAPAAPSISGAEVNISNIVTGTAHIPIGTRGGYFTTNGVRKVAVNTALDIIDIAHYGQLIESFTGSNPIHLHIGDDKNDKSAIVGAVAVTAAGIVAGKYMAPPAAVAIGGARGVVAGEQAIPTLGPVLETSLPSEVAVSLGGGASEGASAASMGRVNLTYGQGFDLGYSNAEKGFELILGKFPGNVEYVANNSGTVTLDVPVGWTRTYNAGYVRGYLEAGGKIRFTSQNFTGTFELEARQVLGIPGAP